MAAFPANLSGSGCGCFLSAALPQAGAKIGRPGGRTRALARQPLLLTMAALPAGQKPLRRRCPAVIFY